MAYTTDNYQTGLATRLGETSAPNDGTTKNIRLSWANDGLLTISRRRYWWWQEATSIANANTGSTTGYPDPDDLKEFIELKVGDVYYDQIPYQNSRNYQGTTAIVTLPSLRTSFKYYRFGGRYYFSVVDSADAAVHNIKYFKRISRVTDGGTFLLPEDYSPALEAYGEARYWLSITQQAKAAAPFAEFEEIVNEMAKENGRRGTGHPAGFGVQDPDDGFPE